VSAVGRMVDRSEGERGRGERGAALVELSVVAMLLIVIAFGIVEFGSAMNRKLEVETASRSGARVGSSLGSQRMADYGLLDATKSALNDIGLSNVAYVVVYKSTTANGARTGTCAGNTPTSQAGLCNVYTGSQVVSLTQADFTSTGSPATCGTTAPDRFWCPTTRQNVQSLGADYIGVWIKAKYTTITGIFKSPFSLTSAAVMRLEPK
jgi:Flp pilus assembly protein TadG